MENKVDESYVSFELAQLAKANGFNWLTNKFYYETDSIYAKKGSIGTGYDSDYWGNTTLYDWNEYGVPFKPFGEAASCMLLSTLQKWLRDEYNIHVWIVPATDSTFRAWVTNDLRLDLINSMSCNATLTYEESLELGLRKAIKKYKNVR